NPERDRSVLNPHLVHRAAADKQTLGGGKPEAVVLRQIGPPSAAEQREERPAGEDQKLRPEAPPPAISAETVSFFVDQRHASPGGSGCAKVDRDFAAAFVDIADGVKILLARLEKLCRAYHVLGMDEEDHPDP